MIYLESGCELSDKPYDFVVLDVVVPVLHEISPQNLDPAQTKSKITKNKKQRQEECPGQASALDALDNHGVSNSG